MIPDTQENIRRKMRGAGNAVLRVRLEDKDVVRIIARGDPRMVWRTRAQRRTQERRLIAEGRVRPLGAFVANVGAGVLDLVKRRGPVRLELSELDPSTRGVRRTVFAPGDVTPLGETARALVTRWLRGKPDPGGEALARAYLKRRA